MSKYTHFTKLKHLIFPNGGSSYQRKEAHPHRAHSCLRFYINNLWHSIRAHFASMTRPTTSPRFLMHYPVSSRILRRPAWSLPSLNLIRQPPWLHPSPWIRVRCTPYAANNHFSIRMAGICSSWWRHPKNLQAAATTVMGREFGAYAVTGHNNRDAGSGSKLLCSQVWCPARDSWIENLVWIKYWFYLKLTLITY
jgi:hypothetical protein